jgi:hypothetical protein
MTLKYLYFENENSSPSPGAKEYEYHLVLFSLNPKVTLFELSALKI